MFTHLRDFAYIFLILLENLFGLASNIQKHFSYILVLLRTCLIEPHSKLVSQLFALFQTNFSFVRITLIAHKYLDNVRRSMSFDLFHPVLDIIKWVPIIDCIGQNNSHCSPIIRLCDCFKTLLSCSVPDLKLNLRASQVEHFGFEIYAWIRGGIPMVERWEVRKLF